MQSRKAGVCIMRNNKFLVASLVGCLLLSNSVAVFADTGKTPTNFDATSSELNGELVISIPERLPLSRSGDYLTGTDVVTAKGVLSPVEVVSLTVDPKITYVNQSDNSINIEADVSFGTNGVAEWTAEQLKANMNSDSPIGYNITSSVLADTVEYIGEYDSHINYTISVVDRYTASTGETVTKTGTEFTVKPPVGVLNSCAWIETNNSNGSVADRYYFDDGNNIVFDESLITSDNIKLWVEYETVNDSGSTVWKQDIILINKRTGEVVDAWNRHTNTSPYLSNVSAGALTLSVVGVNASEVTFTSGSKMIRLSVGDVICNSDYDRTYNSANTYNCYNTTNTVRLTEISSEIVDGTTFSWKAEGSWGDVVTGTCNRITRAITYTSFDLRNQRLLDGSHTSTVAYNVKGTPLIMNNNSINSYRFANVGDLYIDYVDADCVASNKLTATGTIYFSGTQEQFEAFANNRVTGSNVVYNATMP